MSINRFNFPFFQGFEASTGNVGAGWKLYFWVAGSTSTAQTTYSDSARTVANANPVVADANGRWPDIFLADAAYNVELKDSNDVLLDSADNVGSSTTSSAVVGKEIESQTTTYGQTVFTLTGLTYTPGANNLEVYYNGNLAENGVDYTETSSTVITWTGVTIAASGRITFIKNSFVSSSAPLASNTSYTPAGSGAIATDVQTKLREWVSVKDFGAVGDGVTDDTAAIQAAIDAIEAAGGGTIFFPYGDYRLSVTKGTNDKYGIQIGGSNIKLKGEKGASIRRLSSDISSYALSFPLLLVGVPDNNATQLLDFEINGLEFVGEDTRHTTSGSALMDGRQAIWVKNVKGFKATNCKFDQIDSSAIWFQRPGDYDYENSAYYNTTKCYDVLIKDCEFIAASHSTAGRALLHAIVAKVDNCRVIDNYFEWCDDALTCSTTYDDYEDVETDTYTDSNLSLTVKRVGRGYVVKGNIFYNSSEHCLYLEAMGITCSGNTVIVDDPTTCNSVQYQIRGRGVSVDGDTMTGVARAASINTGSIDVSFKPGAIQANGDSSGGIINIQSQGLTNYIDNRSDFFGSYKPMENITVSCIITMSSAAQTNGVGIRLYTDTSDANFPDGQMRNVNIAHTTINNAKKAILNIANMGRNIQIDSNIFNGKAFTEAGFTTGTSMNSLCALAIDDSLTAPLQQVSFDNNTVYGFEYILYDDGGAASAGTVYAPYGIRGNNMSYIKYWDTAAFIEPDFENRFKNNRGSFFLDRTGWFSNTAIDNSLSDGTANSEKKSCIQLVSSTDVRIYHDDSAGYKAL